MKNFKMNGSILIILILLQLNVINGAAFGGGSLTSYNEDDGDRIITQNSDLEFTNGNYPSNDKVIKTVVNINDSGAAALLNNFNVSIDEIRSKMAASHSVATPHAATTSSVDQHRKDDVNTTTNDGNNDQEDMFIDVLRKHIESIVERNSSKSSPDPNAVIHEMALYPVCSKNNETSWLEENTAKLYFSSNIFDKLMPNTFLHSAVLRLRQKNPDIQTGDRNKRDTQTAEPGCSEPDSIIRVTISVMVKRRGGNNRIGSNTNSGNNRREGKYKKTICNSFTTSRGNSGWIEMDMRQAIKYWEKSYRTNVSQNKGAVSDPMVAIDVEDEHQVPLKAGLYFEPTDCQASSAIPWSLYGNVRDFHATNILPNYPRLDIKYSRVHRPHNHHHHHYYRRIHRHRNYNHFENVRLLKETPMMPANYQYQADQGNFNYVTEETTRNHRKRHIQHKHNQENVAHGNVNDEQHQPHRSRRSLNLVNRNNSRRRVVMFNK